MRINADAKSEQFWLLHFPRSMRVTVDGVEQRHAVEADDVEGWIVREVWDDKIGQPLVGEDCIVREKVFGEVRFEVAD